MNIFILDKTPYKAAVAQCDKHIVKMMTESTQILCSALYLGGCRDLLPMKPTHLSHPCVKWAAEGKENWLWLYAHARCLVDEYRHRYKNETKIRKYLDELTWHHPVNFLPRGGTPFAICVGEPVLQNVSDTRAVEIYRMYYKQKKNKMQMRWTRRDPPEWWE